MASRMDRYYERPRNPKARSVRNEELYQKIRDMDNYSNIEAIETISKTNEIDISRVKEMIKNRENFKKQKQYRDAFSIEKQDESHEESKNYFQKEKNYDIMDILKKAKNSHEEDSTNRSLKNLDYDIVKELKLRCNSLDKNKMDDDVAQQTDIEDGDLLDDLKADTMVGEASSIHKILEQEKNSSEKVDNTSDLDKSFFTSTMSFMDDDFEDLRNINHRMKKGKRLLIILIVLALLIISGIIIFLIIRR